MSISSIMTVGFAALMLFSVSGLKANPDITTKGNATKDKYIVVFKKSDFPNNRQSGVRVHSYSSLNKFGESPEDVAARLLVDIEHNQRTFDNKNGKVTSLADIEPTNKIGVVFSHAIQGFSATLTPESVAYLKLQPEIDYIEPDQIISVNATQTPPPSWGLDRIDQLTLPLDNSYNYNEDGAGVHAYIIDTGLRSTHNDFAGRVGDGYDFVNNDNDPEDCMGHGTHVAGTVAGQSYGVAKNAIIHSLKVFGCVNSGSLIDIISAVDWVRLNYQSPAVINMSLGSSGSNAMDSAVNAVIDAGITVVTSGGNNGLSPEGKSPYSCDYSPARVPNAITVGNTTSSDSRAPTSNFGSCLDLFAPGELILSAYWRSDSDTATLSGTSMASPHVAGVIANYLESRPGATPAEVSQLIINNATADVVTDARGGSPNRLLFNVLDENAPPATTIPSTQNFVWRDGNGIADRWKFANVFDNGQDVYVTHRNNGQYYASQLNADGSIINKKWSGGHGIANRWDFSNIFGGDRELYVTHSNNGQFYATQLNSDESFQNFKWSGGHGIANHWRFADIFGEGRGVYVTHSNNGQFYATQLNSDESLDNWSWTGHGVANRWTFADIFGEGKQVYLTHRNDGSFFATQLNSDDTVETWKWIKKGHGMADRWFMADIFGEGRQVYVTHKNNGTFYATQLNVDGTFNNWKWTGGHGASNRSAFVDFYGTGQMVYVSHSNTGTFYITRLNKDETVTNWTSRGHGIANISDFADIFGIGKKNFVTHSHNGEFYSTQGNQ
jgi:subtilisin family serine protease